MFISTLLEDYALKTYSSIIAEDIRKLVLDLQDQVQGLAGTTLLITGAGGFLCSYFVHLIAALNEAVLNSPCRIIAIDKRFSDQFDYLENRTDVQFIEADATQDLNLDESVDWLIHGASIASPTFYRRFPLETIDVNVSGTRKMLDLTRRMRARGMLFLSTSEIYGDPDPQFIPTPEEYRGNVSCTGPRACYDESKRLGETLCVTYHQLYHVPVKIVRPFNVYGPGQRLDDGRIIPDLMKSSVLRKPIALFSDGRASRAFCYISDAIDAMCRILLSPAEGEPFNVGNDQLEVTIGDLAHIVREVAGPPFLEVEFRVSEDPNYITDNPQRRCPDLTKLKSQFGWKPQIPLREGLARTLRFYLEEKCIGRPHCA